MLLKQSLEHILAGNDLSHADMLILMQQVMSGELTPAQIAGLVIALRQKGESVDEISAAATVMRSLSTKVAINDNSHLIDTCGTGGDGIQTFNVSTTSAFVAAAAGAPDRAFDLGMPEQELDGPQVASAPIDQSSLRTP